MAVTCRLLRSSGLGLFHISQIEYNIFIGDLTFMISQNLLYNLYLKIHFVLNEVNKAYSKKLQCLRNYYYSSLKKYW